MLEVELRNKTSLELTLFKEFAKFIIIQNKKNIGKDYFNPELVDILQLKIKPGTLGNKFSDAENNDKPFKIPDICYKNFCSKFIATFNNKLTPDKQEDYREIEDAFYQWKFKLDSKYNISHETLPTQVDEIGTEKMIYNIEEQGNEHSHSANNLDFFGAFDLVKKFYTYDGHRDHIYESILADMLDNLVDLRRDKDFQLSILNDHHISRFKAHFSYISWKIYELHGDRVICRSVHFSQHKDWEETYGFKSFIKLGRKEDLNIPHGEPVVSAYDIFTYNYAYSLTVIENCMFERHGIASNSPYNETFTFQTQDLDKGLFVGHKCTSKDLDHILCVPVFLVADDVKTDLPHYMEYDINSNHIPPKIRSRLVGWKFMDDVHPYLFAFLTTSFAINSKTFEPSYKWDLD